MFFDAKERSKERKITGIIMNDLRHNDENCWNRVSEFGINLNNFTAHI
jgi:Mrp family chromosome partitioning ATPase